MFMSTLGQVKNKINLNILISTFYYILGFYKALFQVFSTFTVNSSRCVT